MGNKESKVLDMDKRRQALMTCTRSQPTTRSIPLKINQTNTNTNTKQKEDK
jgi:hypothetical protein